MRISSVIDHGSRIPPPSSAESRMGTGEEIERARVNSVSFETDWSVNQLPVTLLAGRSTPQATLSHAGKSKPATHASETVLPKGR
jgi:hypothetical protein